MGDFAKIYRIDNYRIPYASLIADDNLSIERDRENIRSIVFQIVESVCVGKYYSNGDIIKELGGSNYFGEISDINSQCNEIKAWFDCYEESFRKLIDSGEEIFEAQYYDGLDDKVFDEFEEDGKSAKSRFQSKLYDWIGNHGTKKVLAKHKEIEEKSIESFNTVFYNEVRQVFYDGVRKCYWLDDPNDNELMWIEKFSEKELEERCNERKKIYDKFDLEITYEADKDSLYNEGDLEGEKTCTNLWQFAGYWDYENEEYIDFAKKIEQLTKNDPDYASRLFGCKVDENGTEIGVGDKKSRKKLLTCVEVLIAMAQILSDNVYCFLYPDDAYIEGKKPQRKMDINVILESEFFDDLLYNMIIRTANNVIESVRYVLYEKSNDMNNEVKAMLRQLDILQYRLLPAVRMLLKEKPESIPTVKSRTMQSEYVLREIALNAKKYDILYKKWYSYIFDDLYRKSSNLYSPYLIGDTKIADHRDSYFNKHIASTYSWLKYWQSSTTMEAVEFNRRNFHIYWSSYRYGNITNAIRKMLLFVGEVKNTEDEKVVEEIGAIDTSTLEKLLSIINECLDNIDKEREEMKKNKNRHEFSFQYLIIFEMIDRTIPEQWSEIVEDLYDKYNDKSSRTNDKEVKRMIRKVYVSYYKVLELIYKIYCTTYVRVSSEAGGNVKMSAADEKLLQNIDFEEHINYLSNELLQQVREKTELMDEAHTYLADMSKKYFVDSSEAPRGEMPRAMYRNVLRFDDVDFNILADTYETFLDLGERMKKDIKEMIALM